MIFFCIAIFTVYAVSVATLAWGLKRAPRGFQDDQGFHLEDQHLKTVPASNPVAAATLVHSRERRAELTIPFEENHGPGATMRIA